MIKQTKKSLKISVSIAKYKYMLFEELGSPISVINVKCSVKIAALQELHLVITC